jgi:hypothetical protein
MLSAYKDKSYREGEQCYKQERTRMGDGQVMREVIIQASHKDLVGCKG